MAITLQPYPTMADLRGKAKLGLGHGPVNRPVRATWGLIEGPGLGALGDDLLFATIKARDIGLVIPGLPANATLPEAAVYETLVNLAITEVNLRQTYANLNGLVLVGKPVRCQDLVDYNALVDSFIDQASHAVGVFVAAGLGAKIQRLPQSPPKFEIGIGQRFGQCVLRPGSVVGAGLGFLPGVVGAIWVLDLIVVATIGTALVFLAKSWGDVELSREATKQMAVTSEMAALRSQIWRAMGASCTTDACRTTVGAQMAGDLESLRKLAATIKAQPDSGHGLIWWAGVVSLVGLFGAGVYAYKTRKG